MLYGKINIITIDACCKAYPNVSTRRRKLDELRLYLNDKLKRLLSRKKKLHKKYRNTEIHMENRTGKFLLIQAPTKLLEILMNTIC